MLAQGWLPLGRVPAFAGMTGEGAGMTEGVAGCNDGAALGEIPAASAGMTVGVGGE